jgi:hypothetical protein
MKKQNVLTIILVALFSLTLATACEQKQDEASTDTGGGAGGGGGAATVPSDLQHTFMKCLTTTTSDGSSLNNKYHDMVLELKSDFTYHYYITYRSGTGCTIGMFSSGSSEDVFDYDQTGTFSVSSDDGAGTYEITMTSTTQTITGRSGTVGAPMMAAVNANCVFGGSTVTAGHSLSVNNIFCGNSNNTNYIVPSFPSIGTVSKQKLVITSTAAQSSVPIGVRDSHWVFGSTSSFPSTTETWKIYQ